MVRMARILTNNAGFAVNVMVGGVSNLHGPLINLVLASVGYGVYKASKPKIKKERVLIIRDPQFYHSFRTSFRKHGKHVVIPLNEYS